MLKKALTHVKNNLLIAAFVVLGLVSYLATREAAEVSALPSFAAEPKSVDTFIPQGFVLVPIEIVNAESLSSLVGDVGGVVDLYLASNDTQKGGLKVGSKLKILRAPLNPQQYAVLVKDAESSRLLSFTGPFVAVVQNPKAQGTTLTSSGPARVRVDYQN